MGVKQLMKDIKLYSPPRPMEHGLIIDIVTFLTQKLSEVAHWMGLNISLGSWDVHSQSKN